MIPLSTCLSLISYQLNILEDPTFPWYLTIFGGITVFITTGCNSSYTEIVLSFTFLSLYIERKQNKQNKKKKSQPRPPLYQKHKSLYPFTLVKFHQSARSRYTKYYKKVQVQSGGNIKVSFFFCETYSRNRIGISYTPKF